MRLCLLVLLLFTTTTATTKLVACYDYLDDGKANMIGGTEVDLASSSGSLYSLCEAAANSAGSPFFAVYDSTSSICYTASWDQYDGYYEEYDQEASCEHVQVYQKMDDEEVSVEAYEQGHLSCASGNIWVLETEIGCEESTYTESTYDVEDSCNSYSSCDWYHDPDRYSVYPCSAAELVVDVTYICIHSSVYDIGYQKTTDIAGILEGVVRNLFWPVVIILAIISLYWHRQRLQQVPALQEACWRAHIECPCLKLYPPGAAHPRLPAQQAPPNTWGQQPLPQGQQQGQQGSWPPHQGSMPPHQGSMPPHQGSMPPHQGSMPPHQGSMPPSGGPHVVVPMETGAPVSYTAGMPPGGGAVAYNYSAHAAGMPPGGGGVAYNYSADAAGMPPGGGGVAYNYSADAAGGAAALPYNYSADTGNLPPPPSYNDLDK